MTTNVDVNDFPGVRIEKDWDWWSSFLQREYYSSDGEKRGWDAAAADVARAVDLRPGARVLDLGCGAGEMLFRLAVRGASVVGVEQSGSLVRYCRERAVELGVPAAFVEASMFEYESAEPFDVVLSLNTSFGYGTDEQNRELIARVARLMAPGGVFLLDVASADSAESFGQWGDELAGGTLIVDNHYEADSQTMVSAPYWITEDEQTIYYAREPERVRLYTRAEIEALFQQQGLSSTRLRRAMGRRFNQDASQIMTTWLARKA